MQSTEPKQLQFRLARRKARTSFAILTLAAVPLLQLPTALAAQSSSDRAPTFYNFTDDPSSLMLLDLNGVAGKGANTTVDVINLFGPPLRTGNFSTWRIDCPNHRMQIIRSANFTPTDAGKLRPVQSKVVSSSNTPVTRTIYRLACSGEGGLLSSKTYFDPLSVIVKRFWR